MKLKHLTILIFILLGLSSSLRSAEPLCDFKADDFNGQPLVNEIENAFCITSGSCGGGWSNYSEPEIQAVWTGPTEWMNGSAWAGETFYWSIWKGVDYSCSNLEQGDYVKVSIVFDTGAANQTLCQTFRSEFAPDPVGAGVGTFPGQA